MEDKIQENEEKKGWSVCPLYAGDAVATRKLVVLR